MILAESCVLPQTGPAPVASGSPNVSAAPVRGQRHKDITGRAHAGGQRQIQTYVNERTSELCHAIVMALQPCQDFELIAAGVAHVSED
jgi:hypothetical protein